LPARANSSGLAVGRAVDRAAALGFGGCRRDGLAE
jgi:hypothetical protein